MEALPRPWSISSGNFESGSPLHAISDFGSIRLIATVRTPHPAVSPIGILSQEGSSIEGPIGRYGDGTGKPEALHSVLSHVQVKEEQEGQDPISW